jgi:hypothetical protein
MRIKGKMKHSPLDVRKSGLAGPYAFTYRTTESRHRSNGMEMRLNLWFHAKKFLPESFRLRSSASMSLSLKSAAQAGRS